MIVGVGVDLCVISRMVAHRSDDLFVCRIFTEEERGYAQGPLRAQRLAVRWAAREAFAKAVGLTIGQLGLCGVSVSLRHDGRPYLLFHSPRAKKVMQGRRAHLSLSHDGEVAVAFVVIEEENS